jgi:hypothetical protein
MCRRSAISFNGKGSTHRWVHFHVDAGVGIAQIGDMPRQLRLQYPGVMYRLMSRGNRREKRFLDDVDRQDFLKTLAEELSRRGWSRAELEQRCKNDPDKLEIAARLRRETTLRVKEIALRKGFNP